MLKKVFSGEYDPSLLIIYGPRKVGKSELLRYFTTARSKKFRKVYYIYFNVKDIYSNDDQLIKISRFLVRKCS